jgi:hypothetical protein
VTHDESSETLIASTAALGSVAPPVDVLYLGAPTFLISLIFPLVLYVPILTLF